MFVPAGADRDGEQHGLGISTIAFKLSTPGGDGKADSGIFIIENTFHQKGGPARHLHIEQDEWFYIAEGTFMFEIGQERMQLKPGDSLFGPRNVPHVWASVGEGRGRILITFLPAGKMEAFFREVTKTNAMPIQDPKLWRDHGMELMGPPLAVG